jgi:hypothetical protein
MLRQIEFALFDLRIHHDIFEQDLKKGAERMMETLAHVRSQVAVLHPPSFQRFPQSFSHIFAGGYAAGYYSYKWAEVLSADAYAAFEEEPQNYGAVGQGHALPLSPFEPFEGVSQVLKPCCVIRACSRRPRRRRGEWLGYACQLECQFTAGAT